MKTAWVIGAVVLAACAAGAYLATLRPGAYRNSPREAGRRIATKTASESHKTSDEPSDERTVATTATVSSVTSGSATESGNPEADRAPGSSRYEAYIASLASDPEALYLPESERVYLWNIEQCAFELERHVFPSLADALRNGDRTAWQRKLHPQFKAQIPRTIDTAADRPFVHVKSWHHDVDPSRVVDGNEFLRFLFAVAARYQSIANVKFGLPRLGAVSRGDLTGDWNAVIQLEFRGTTHDGELSETAVVAEARFARLSSRSRDDEHWVERMDVTRMTSSRAGEAMLVDVAKARGLEPERFHDNWLTPTNSRKVVTGGIYLNDFNQDDWLDVLVTDLRGNVLYRGSPTGQFEDVTRQAGISDFGPGGVAAFADLDNDGDEDLVAASDMRLAFYRNGGNGRFDLVRTTRPPRSVPSITIADFDRDGLVDLYLPGDAPVPFLDRGPRADTPSYIGDRTGQANVLFRNRGQWRFQNVTDSAGLAGDGGSDFTALWFDADSDGSPDVVAVNELGKNFFALNEGKGTFRPGNLEGDAAPGFSMGGSAGDFDNDGLIDLYISNMYSKAGSRVIGNVDGSLYPPGHAKNMQAWVGGNSLYRNKRQGQFQDVARDLSVHAVGFAYGSSFVDLDNDGWLDIYALAGFHSVSRTEPDG
jgi:hypothetical protein